MTLAGDYLLEIRNGCGYSRSRRKFLDDTDLPWEEETLRSLEDGTNLIIVDHIRAMVKAGIFKEGDEEFIKILDLAARDALHRKEFKERLKLIKEQSVYSHNKLVKESDNEDKNELFDLLYEMDGPLGNCIGFLLENDLSKSDNADIRQLYLSLDQLRRAVLNIREFLIAQYDPELNEGELTDEELSSK